MGTKERSFAQLIHRSLEELVPHDHFYRHLERTLDLSFVREFVQKTYACKGSRSVRFIASTRPRRWSTVPMLPPVMRVHSKRNVPPVSRVVRCIALSMQATLNE